MRGVRRMQIGKYVKHLLILLVALTLLVAPIYAQDHGETTTDDHATTTEVVEHAAEEGSGGIAALGINAGFLIAQIINFLIIAGGLSMLLWKPAVNMLDNRSSKIQKGLEDAAAAAKARQNAEAEADKIMEEARRERSKMLEEARQQGDDVKKGIESDARQSAERIRTEAQQDAVTARDAELASLRDQVIKISTALAGRLLNESIDEKKQAALVSDFFAKVPANAKSLSGDVTVISAMPLSDGEKKKLEGEIKASSYTYNVDPNILGGLVVRSADRVIDGSVRSGLNDLSSTIK